MTDQHQTSSGRVESLRGLRLGRHARRVLIEASGPLEAPVVLATCGAMERDALCRAQRQLARLGLVWITRRSPPARALLPFWHSQKIDCPHLAGVNRTPLGDAVVRVIGDTLRAGKPVRWTDRTLAAIRGMYSS